MATLEKLYENYGVLADARDQAGKHEEAFKIIMNGAKGDIGVRTLAAQFIPKFLKYFPQCAEAALDSLIDLYETDSPQVRHAAIKGFSLVCKSTPTLVHKTANVLMQLIQIENKVENALVKDALDGLFEIDFRGVLHGVFAQIESGDEKGREIAIQFVKTEIVDKHSKYLYHDANNMKLFSELTKKTLLDVSGSEFTLFIELLFSMKVYKTSAKAQELFNMIADQLETGEDFVPDKKESCEKVAICMKMADKIYQSGIDVTRVVGYVCTTILPKLDKVLTTHTLDILKYFVSIINHACLVDVSAFVPPVHNSLLLLIPASAIIDDNVDIQFSQIECLLISFYKLLQHTSAFWTENKARLEDTKKRFHYLARKSQLFSEKLSKAHPVGLQKRKAEEAINTTNNIVLIIRDLVRITPTFTAKPTLTVLDIGKPKIINTTISRKRSAPTVSTDNSKKTKEEQTIKNKTKLKQGDFRGENNGNWKYGSRGGNQGGNQGGNRGGNRGNRGGNRGGRRRW